MPRRPGGARFAISASEAGAHSISPRTKTTITMAIVPTPVATSKARNESPITGIATPSLAAADTCATASVRRTWRSATSSGLSASRTPHVRGERSYAVVAATGNALS